MFLNNSEKNEVFLQYIYRNILKFIFQIYNYIKISPDIEFLVIESGYTIF